MKVYCAHAYIQAGNSSSVNTAVGAVKRKDIWKTWSGIKKYDCNECKHKLKCLVEPSCNRTYESK